MDGHYKKEWMAMQKKNGWPLQKRMEDHYKKERMTPAKRPVKETLGFDKAHMVFI